VIEPCQGEVEDALLDEGIGVQFVAVGEVADDFECRETDEGLLLQRVLEDDPQDSGLVGDLYLGLAAIG
jgi:hypothetical protein